MANKADYDFKLGGDPLPLNYEKRILFANTVFNTEFILKQGW